MILRTHVDCNNGQSTYDEQIAQAVSLLWKTAPTPKDVSSLQVSMHALDGMAPFGSFESFPLQAIVARWLKGFHAALYGAPLPRVNGFIHSPLPGGDEPGTDTSLHRAHAVFVAEIKKNRTAPRQFVAAIGCGGLVYAIGGTSSYGGGALDTVEAFDPSTNQWLPQGADANVQILSRSGRSWRLHLRNRRRSCR